MFPDTFAELARSPALKGRPTALALLHQLPLVLDFDRWQRIDQSELALLLQTSQPVISRNLAALVHAGALEKKGGRGVGTRYRLHPKWGWRGTAGQFHAAQAERSREVNQNGEIGPLTDATFGTDYTLRGNCAPEPFTSRSPSAPSPEATFQLLKAAVRNAVNDLGTARKAKASKADIADLLARAKRAIKAFEQHRTTMLAAAPLTEAEAKIAADSQA